MKIIALILLLLPGFIFTPEVPASPPAPVYVIPVEGEIAKGLVWVVRRGIREAEAASAEAIVIWMNTNGGAAAATEEIMELLARTDLPTYTFVDIKAFSAGAYIAVATDHIYMAPGSMIGAATPIAASPLGGPAQMDEAHAEKITSAFRAMIASTAEEKGHPVEVVEAMVDRDVEIPDLIEKGKLLTLTNTTALEAGLSRGTVSDLDRLFEEAGFPDAPRELIRITPAESLARFITGSMITVLLLLGGMAGIYFEIRSPGFGLPGILGLSLLAVFFFGHNVAGLAGREVIILFVIGLILLLIELFFTPDFGLLGAGGIICIILSFVLAMGRGPLFDPQTILSPNYFRAVTIFGGALGGFLVLILSTYRMVFTSSSPLYGRFVLTAAEKREQGFESSESGISGLVGARGEALTKLRPAGKARLGGRPVDVVSLGEYIDRGEEVRVVAVDGNRVVVRKV